ncbi:hypothetical protein L1987_33551 [Smallanthus sonchifolius]|uniref:Uncharacterized protein n=1 Tax=Smallanthus sonchifolius TaxID=185202 RepID=A0ACB9HSQ2_9ASTR|nr:hypothetical protein L1987_33551 [Smallanthus sonchifolius]
MVYSLNPKEIIDLLYEQQNIKRSFTKTVWEELEKQIKNCLRTTIQASLRLVEKELPKLFILLFLYCFDYLFEYAVGMIQGMTRWACLQSLLNLVVIWAFENFKILLDSMKKLIMTLDSGEKSDRTMYTALLEQEAVWQHLEEQNKKFFRNYYLRLAVMAQIRRFDSLLEKQAAVMTDQLYPPNEVAAVLNERYNLPETATALEIDRSQEGILGLQFQAPPDHQSSPAPPANDNQQSSSC